jgi:hypothetical protein
VTCETPPSACGRDPTTPVHAIVEFALVLLIVTGCSRQSESLSATYQGIADPGFIDQTMTFTLAAKQAQRLHLRYTPIDRRGSVLPDVAVQTAFGSDSGQLVVTDNSNLDILYFSGAAADQVADVRIEVVASSPVPAVDLQAAPVEIARYTSTSDEVEKFDVFDSVLVTNPNNSAVAARPVCLNYDDPAPGRSQQAIERIEVVDRVALEGGESRSVEVSSSFRELARSRGYGCASVKSHFVP